MSIVLGPEHPFWGVKAKIERAEDHLHLLNQEFDEWCDRYPHGLVAIPEVQELDPDTGEYLATLTFDVNPPHWGVIIGEVLHDVRTALNQLVVSVSASPTEDTGFPCALTAGDFKSCRPMIATVPEKFLTLIKDAQPYRRGERDAAMLDPLWRLHQLNNRDKHRMLLVTLLGHKDASGDFKSVWERGDIEAITFNVGPTHDATDLMNVQFREGSEGEMNMQGDAAPRVVFDEPDVPSVHRWPVLKILLEIVEAGRDVTSAFFRAET